jgi:hypothetical protein
MGSGTATGAQGVTHPARMVCQLDNPINLANHDAKLKTKAACFDNLRFTVFYCRKFKINHP